MKVFIFGVSQLILRWVFRALFRIKVEGRDDVPRHGKLLLAANHVVAIDPLLIASFAPRQLHFLGKREIFGMPVLGRLAKFFNCIPIDRADVSPSTLKTIGEIFERGGGLLLFPEGTRTKDGAIAPFKAGIGLIAARNEVGIVPVCTSGLFQAKSRWWRRPRIVLRFGQVIPVKQYLDGGAKKAIYAAIASELAARMRQLAG